MGTTKRYDLFDLIKLLASVLIFVMHINAFSDVSENYQFFGVQLACRWGVPFFFITSAFFLFRKGKPNISKEDLTQYVKRIVTLYGIWLIFNAPQVIYSHFVSRNLSCFTTWSSFLIKLICGSTFTGSWYLTSSVFSACFVYFLRKRFSSQTTILISALLYLVCIITSAYGGLLPPDITTNLSEHFVSPFCSIICGPLFFAIGEFFAQNQWKYEKISVGKCMAGFCVSGALYYCEIVMLRHMGALYSTDASIFVIPWAIYLFLLCLNSTVTIPCATILRKISTIIYCCQGLVIVSSIFICRYILKLEHSLFPFMLGSVMILLCICAVFFLQKQPRYKWGRFLT